MVERNRRNSDPVYRDLLSSLEKARSRLAVAMAAEAKTMPLVLRKNYIEMENRMRSCLRDLRSQAAPISLEWKGILQSLRQLPGPPEPGSKVREARLLFTCLKDILDDIERVPDREQKPEA